VRGRAECRPAFRSGRHRYHGRVSYAVESRRLVGLLLFAAPALTGSRLVVPRLGTDSSQGYLVAARLLAPDGVRGPTVDLDTVTCWPRAAARGGRGRSPDVDVATTLIAIAPSRTAG